MTDCPYCDDGERNVISTLGKIVAATAIAGTLQNATGKHWQLRGNYFYEIFPITNEYTGNKLSSEIAKMYKTLKDSGISNIKYTEGDFPGVQGKDDPREFMCQNFALNAVWTIVNSGGHAAAVSIWGRDPITKEQYHHAVIALQDFGNMQLYLIDPIGLADTKQPKTPLQIKEEFEQKLKNPMNYTPVMGTKLEFTLIPTMTLVEPQTNEILLTGTQFEGKMYSHFGHKLRIEHIEIIGAPIRKGLNTTSRSRDIISESTDWLTSRQKPGTQNTSPLPREQLEKRTTIMARRNERIV